MDEAYDGTVGADEALVATLELAVGPGSDAGGDDSSSE